MEENTKKIAALLDHLVHHNEHHAEEIHELAENAKKPATMRLRLSSQKA